MKLPPKQRRPMPEAPESFDHLLSGGISSHKMQQYNEAAYNKWDTEALIACPNCARTFLPDRLEIHLRSCKADRPLKPRLEIAAQQSYNQQQQYQQPQQVQKSAVAASIVKNDIKNPEVRKSINSKQDPAQPNKNQQKSLPQHIINNLNKQTNNYQSNNSSQASQYNQYDSEMQSSKQPSNNYGELQNQNKQKQQQNQQLSVPQRLQANPKFFQNSSNIPQHQQHVPQMAVMFTLDEGDDETEYGESFKSSMKSQSLSTAHFTFTKDQQNSMRGGAIPINQSKNKINFVKKMRSREDQVDDDEDDYDDEDESDLEPDDNYKSRGINDFQDEEIIYHNLSKDDRQTSNSSFSQQQQVQPVNNKRKVDNIQINVQKIDQQTSQGGNTSMSFGNNVQGVPQSAIQNMKNQDDRISCQFCERKFAANRIDKHEETCQKQKPRKTFDTQKQRMAEVNQDAGMISQSSQKQQKSSSKPAVAKKQSTTQQEKDAANEEKKAKWKQQHESLISAIRISKKMKQLEDNGGDVKEIQALASQIPQQNTEELVPCPYCQRKFNPNTADRHIPKCKDTINKPKPPPALRNQNNMQGPQNQQNQSLLSITKKDSEDKKNLSGSKSTSQSRSKVVAQQQNHFNYQKPPQITAGQGSPNLNSSKANNYSKSPLKSILKSKAGEINAKSNINQLQVKQNILNENVSSSSSNKGSYQDQNDLLKKEQSISQKILDIIKSPFKSNQHLDNEDEQEEALDSKRGGRYDLPRQTTDMFSPAAKSNLLSYPQSVETSNRPSTIVDEVHANQVNHSEYNLLGSAGKRKISGFESPEKQTESHSTNYSNLKQAGKLKDDKDGKKKVHFVRSHTPKPLKSKIMHVDSHSDIQDLGMGAAASRYLSPIRNAPSQNLIGGPESSFHRQSQDFTNHNQFNDPLNSSKFKHGDVKTRSSMYSSFACPHCNRMFSDAAAQRHIPICEKIIAKPKKLNEKQFSHSQYGQFSHGIQPFKNEKNQSRQKASIHSNTSYNDGSFQQPGSKHNLNSSQLASHASQSSMMTSPKSQNKSISQNLPLSSTRYSQDGAPHNNYQHTYSASKDSYIMQQPSLTSQISNQMLTPSSNSTLNIPPAVRVSTTSSVNTMSYNGTSQLSGISNLNASVTSAPKFCTGCGWQHRDVDRFCGGCGTKRF
eukprot:403332056